MSDLIPFKYAYMALAVAIGTCSVPTHLSAQTPSSLAETYGSWTVQCRSPAAQGGEEARRNCQASQELRQTETGSRVVLVAVTIPEGSESAQMTIIAPFGIFLPDGITLSVGEAEIASAPVRTCLERTGCVAESALPWEQLTSLAEGQELTIQMAAASGQDILVNLSLNGFNETYQRLQELR